MGCALIKYFSRRGGRRMENWCPVTGSLFQSSPRLQAPLQYFFSPPWIFTSALQGKGSCVARQNPEPCGAPALSPSPPAAEFRCCRALGGCGRDFSYLRGHCEASQLNFNSSHSFGAIQEDFPSYTGEEAASLTPCPSLAPPAESPTPPGPQA